MHVLSPDRLKIGYVVLVSTRKFAIEKLQRKAGFADSSKWTHVAGSVGLGAWLDIWHLNTESEKGS